MRIRRCKDLWLEPRETAHVDLEALLSGATGVVTALRWFAHAPPLGQAVQFYRARGIDRLRLRCEDEQTRGFFAHYGFYPLEGDVMEKYIGYEPREIVW